METQKSIFKILVAFLITSLLAFIITLNWMGCKTEDIISPPSSIPVSQIANEIANANTQEKAIIAMKHIIQKVGLGTEVQNSRYNNYLVSEFMTNDFGRIQEQFLNNDTSYASFLLHEMYDTLHTICNSPLHTSSGWQLTGNRAETFLRLQQKGNSALQDPEDPNNAIILMIQSQNGIIPSQMQLYDSLVIKTPIQTFLFAIWVMEEFVIFPSTDDPYHDCVDQAERKCGARESYCEATHKDHPIAKKSCMDGAATDLANDKHACHIQFPGGGH